MTLDPLAVETHNGWRWTLFNVFDVFSTGSRRTLVHVKKILRKDQQAKYNGESVTGENPVIHFSDYERFATFNVNDGLVVVYRKVRLEPQEEIHIDAYPGQELNYWLTVYESNDLKTQKSGNGSRTQSKDALHAPRMDIDQQQQKGSVQRASFNENTVAHPTQNGPNDLHLQHLSSEMMHQQPVQVLRATEAIIERPRAQPDEQNQQHRRPETNSQHAARDISIQGRGPQRRYPEYPPHWRTAADYQQRQNTGNNFQVWEQGHEEAPSQGRLNHVRANSGTNSNQPRKSHGGEPQDSAREDHTITSIPRSSSIRAVLRGQYLEEQATAGPPLSDRTMTTKPLFNPHVTQENNSPPSALRRPHPRRQPARESSENQQRTRRDTFTQLNPSRPHQSYRPPPVTVPSSTVVTIHPCDSITQVMARRREAWKHGRAEPVQPNDPTFRPPTPFLVSRYNCNPAPGVDPTRHFQAQQGPITVTAPTLPPSPQARAASGIPEPSSGSARTEGARFDMTRSQFEQHRDQRESPARHEALGHREEIRSQSDERRDGEVDGRDAYNE